MNLRTNTFIAFASCFMVFPKSSCMSLWLPIYSAVLQAWNYIITLTFPIISLIWQPWRANYSAPSWDSTSCTHCMEMNRSRWSGSMIPYHHPTRGICWVHLPAYCLLFPASGLLTCANIMHKNGLSIILCPTVGHSWSLKWCADHRPSLACHVLIQQLPDFWLF